MTQAEFRDCTITLYYRDGDQGPDKLNDLSKFCLTDENLSKIYFVLEVVLCAS